LLGAAGRGEGLEFVRIVVGKTTATIVVPIDRSTTWPRVSSSQFGQEILSKRNCASSRQRKA
jgi:hypothetical protein